MKKVLTALTLLLLLALAGVAGYFAFRARALGYENDCLADDKAAFLVERSRLEISCAELEAKMNAALEEKAALGRNLVAAMKVCDTLRADASRAVVAGGSPERLQLVAVRGPPKVTSSWVAAGCGDCRMPAPPVPAVSSGGRSGRAGKIRVRGPGQKRLMSGS